jgi:manganese/zinc/iron transport system substrate-binding protein
MLLGALLLGATGCDAASQERSGSPPIPMQTVATTGIAADLLRQVGGDRVEAAALIGAAVDPHLFRPGRSDLRRLLAADLVVAHGLGLEGRMDDAFARLGDAGRRVLVLGPLADPAVLLADPDAPDAPDPHLWMDPILWADLAIAVGGRLGEIDPAGASGHAERAEAYAARLRTLDAAIRSAFDSVPPERRVLVTAHDAFGYLGRRYGVEVESVQGVSTESEAGLRRIEALVRLIRERSIPAIFIEHTVPPRPVQAVIAGVRAAGGSVALGGTLYSDGLGPAGSGVDSVEGMLRHNATTIVAALGGSTDALAAPAHSPQDPRP